MLPLSVDSLKQKVSLKEYKNIMEPHPLANLFKLAACCKPIAKNEEGDKRKGYWIMHLLNEKHDCNDISMNPMNVNCANDMQSYKLGDAKFDEHDISSPLTNEVGYKRKI